MVKKMGYIYIIKNDINKKVYVGQTSRTLEIRGKEHVRHYNQTINQAISKYGAEHFWIEQIEECDDILLDERERYWINYYNSFNSGYNATTGGQDNQKAQTNKMQNVLDLWDSGLTVNRIVEQTKLNVETVRNYLNKNGISHKDIKARANIFIGAAKAKQIDQYDINNIFIRRWDSTAAAVKNGYSKSSIERSLKDGKPHGGYIWKRSNI